MSAGRRMKPFRSRKPYCRKMGGPVRYTRYLATGGSLPRSNRLGRLAIDPVAMGRAFMAMMMPGAMSHAMMPRSLAEKPKKKEGGEENGEK